ncbi:MerR family transcriptional regulator [Bifidobacterium pseudolongum]|uniref:MerR family transcriptional regulator n=1 Tax=Bifidobacterium pseudolongum TaxID=1694 RepID=UPI0013EA7B99|nr:TipAS antibiotic-recognition domain-containing protein [Bifidobacterium pseudolongum]
MQKQLTIGETSARCAVSVRMLRHWESVGLLHPGRDGNGYRLYNEDDIARIRRIRLYRDLGLITEQIRVALDGPATETLSLMCGQRARISGHITQLQLILQDIDELSAYAHNMKEDEDMDTPYTDEAHDRWGDSPQWMEYAEYRTRTDDAQQQADLDAVRALELELAQAMRDGVQPGSEAADELALRHRESLTWYHVTPSMHVCLAKMYVNDPRFRAHYDGIEPGLAVWLRDAIEAQAAAEGVDVENARWE